ncbi:MULTISPECIES: SDR family NAD(P)-dependent oxidoreductase [Nonomuraea]|uniref:Short chain dehydrogenase n=2 Tax=Nonomuraea TaxID=83681 RepID=A0A1H6F1D7_9ACTN|nr:SDR family NAD(P)-dependent oxidoreductase [Nonomuraea solani]SEH03882.1 short chain dehydrogenase [Nonomuraea solani]
MELKNAVAVVTGANRGLGRHLAAQLVEQGAKVYATARRPEILADEPTRNVKQNLSTVLNPA